MSLIPLCRLDDLNDQMMSCATLMRTIVPVSGARGRKQSVTLYVQSEIYTSQDHRSLNIEFSDEIVCRVEVRELQGCEVKKWAETGPCQRPSTRCLVLWAMTSTRSDTDAPSLDSTISSIQCLSHCESPFHAPSPPLPYHFRSGISPVEQPGLRHELGMSLCVQGIFHALYLPYLIFMYQLATRTGDQRRCQRCSQVKNTMMDTLERLSGLLRVSMHLHSYT
jgi:hypothetical protein